jgi:hypothetical protein
MATVGVTKLVTANVTLLLVAVGVDVQPALLVITNEMISPFMGEVKA